MRRSGIIIVILVILALTVNGGCAWMGTPQPSPAAAPPPTTTEASLPSITTPTPPEPSESPVAARETPTPPPTTQTIRIAVWNADMARMTVWRRAWEARHPDILIDIIPIETVADDLLRSSNGSAPSLRAIGEAVSARADVFPTMPWVDLHPDLVADLSALPLPDDAMLKGARERWMTPSIMRTRMTMGVRVRMAAVRASVDRPQDESIWTWQDALRRATPNAPAFDPTAGAAALGGVLIASGIDVAGWSDRVPEADVAADRRLTFRADTDQPFLWGVDLPLADQGSALAPWPRPWTPPIVPEPIAFSVARTAPQPLAWQALRALFADADRWLPNDVLPLSASAARRHPVWDRLDENRRAVVVQAAMRADPPLPPRIAEALRSIVESVCDQNRDAVQSVRSIVMTPDAPSPDAPVAGGASPSTPPESDASLRPLRIAIATLDPSMRDRVAAILSAQGRRPIWVDQESGVATPSDLASRSDCAIMPWDSTMRRVPFDGRDLTPWIQQNPRIIEDLRPQAAALMRSSSERPWFLPLAASPSLLVYRASSVRDLKLNPPTSEWTWNDLRASSDAVFRASGGQRYGYVPFGALGSDALRFLRAHRAPATVIERDHRIRVRYDRSDVIDALMTYRAPVEPLMRHASGRFLDLDGTSSDAMIALIADGRATFWTATPEWFNADDPDLRFAPPPLADAALPEDLNITIGMIPTASSDPDACWRLLSTLTADKSGSPGVIPASRRTPPPASPYADAMVAVMDRALPIAPDDATLAIPLTPFWLWSALDADIDEDARPMRIMTAAYLAIAWVDCVGGRLPVSPNQGLACAQKLDPQHVNALVPSGRHESFPADIGD